MVSPLSYLDQKLIDSETKEASQANLSAGGGGVWPQKSENSLIFMGGLNFDHFVNWNGTYLAECHLMWRLSILLDGHDHMVEMN